MLAPFHQRHRDVADRETAILITTPELPSIPQDEYWFVEWYCVDPACDCRRVRLVVTPKSRPNLPAAVIAWGWDSPEFYRKWLDDAAYARETVEGSLEPMPQSRHGEEFLRIFRERIATEPEFGRRFAEHYALFKQGIIDDPIFQKPGASMTRQQRRLAQREHLKGPAKLGRHAG